MFQILEFFRWDYLCGLLGITGNYLKAVNFRKHSILDFQVSNAQSEYWICFSLGQMSGDHSKASKL